MHSELGTHLERQHAELGAFVALLAEEQAVLSASPVPIDALSDVTERKRQLAERLDRLERQRCSIANAHGESADRAGGDRLAERLGCAELWQDVMQRLDEAREQNRLNGLRIGARLDHTQRTLGFLRQLSAESLYGANGRRSDLRGRRISSGA